MKKILSVMLLAAMPIIVGGQNNQAGKTLILKRRLLIAESPDSGEYVNLQRVKAA